MPEKEGADARTHRQTSSSTEVEELRKTLEVCIRGEDVCTPIGYKEGRACNPESCSLLTEQIKFSLENTEDLSAGMHTKEHKSGLTLALSPSATQLHISCQLGAT